MANFPLYKHANGQWCKTICGKKRYFGTDRDEALDKYLLEKDYLHAGRERPAEPGDGPTLKQAVNLFLADCDQRMQNGEVTECTVRTYEITLKRLVGIRSVDDQPANWTPMDFAAIKEAFFKPVKRGGKHGHGLQVKRRSPSTVDVDIARVKAFLRWCEVSEMIPPPRYGQSFQKSTRKQQRMRRSAAGRRDLAPDAIRMIIDHVSRSARPLMLLGINGALGATDLSLLTVEQYDGEWLHCPRNKTGIDRKVWLWPETRKAIDDYLAKKTLPLSRDNAKLLFLTSRRIPWVQGTRDAVSKSFLDARRECGLTRGTFYDLRRSFQTQADETLDFAAVRFVMGHAPPSNDMSAIYRQGVSDQRIKAVCEHVRKWLYKKSKKLPKR